jgi:nitrogen fixation protein NifU and related proteins
VSQDLYQDALKDLAQKGRGRGRLAEPDRTVTLDNPLCGDRVTMDVALDGDRVAAVGHEVRGCLLCEAGAELIAETVPGRVAQDLRDLPDAVKAYLKDETAAAPVAGLEPFAPARAFRSRHRCVTLPFEALAKALG